MPKTLTVLQPDPIVSLARYGDWLDQHQIPYQVIKLWEEPLQLDVLEQTEALMILGGRCSALDDQDLPWLRQLKPLLGRLVDNNLPVLGICLGHQILAACLGGTVMLNHKEAGEDGPVQITLTEEANDDEIFQYLTGKKLWVYQSHHDAVTKLPTGAKLLAGTSNCAIQAFRYRQAWGVQFHPEASSTVMTAWKAQEGGDAKAMKASCEVVDSQVAEVGITILSAFIDLVNRG